MWSDILGHDKQKAWFENALRQQRLASTFLFVGPPGCGKRTFARYLAKRLLCLRRHDAERAAACEACESCVQFEAGTHPDLLLASKPPDKASLPLGLLVGSIDHRLRDGLCYQLHIKPFHGKRRIAIIDDADTIQVEAANSMLKTLEEPPPGAVIFLIGSNEQRQLPTIRSRSQIVRFQGLSPKHTAQLLLQQSLLSDQQLAEQISQLAEGSLTRAQILIDEDLRQLQQSLTADLSRRPMPFARLSKQLVNHLQSLGDESQLKRERLRILLDFAIDFYRQQLRSEGSRQADQATVVAALKVCLATQSDIDRNATPAGLLESWATELATVCRA